VMLQTEVEVAGTVCGAGIVQWGGDSQSQIHSTAWLKASDVELGIILNGVGEFQPISEVEGDHCLQPLLE